jgi:protein TonB
VATIQVTVGADGKPSVSVMNDPGHGFGRAAKNCALSKQYTSALNRAGTPIASSFPVNVTFSR